MQHLYADPYSLAYAQIDLKKCLVKIRDATTPTANSVTIKVGEGNLTWTERKEREYTLDRGLIDEVRDGDETPMEVSMDLVWEYYEGTGSTVTPIDAIKQSGAASTWVTTDEDICRPYAVDIIVEYDPDCGTGNTETLVFPDFRYEQIDGDLRAGTFALSGRCNATEPISDRND